MKTKPCHCCDGSGKELDQVALGAELKALRVKAKISQRSMAKWLRISAPYLCDLELGRRHWTDALVAEFKRMLV